MNLNINHIICTQQTFNTASIKISSKDSKLYTYKVPVNVELQEDDKVIVMLPNGALKVATVSQVHPTPQIQYGSDVKYSWIVQKVDTTHYDLMEEWERELAGQISHLQAEDIKNQYLDSLSPEMKEALSKSELLSVDNLK